MAPLPPRLAEQLTSGGLSPSQSCTNSFLMGLCKMSFRHNSLSFLPCDCFRSVVYPAPIPHLSQSCPD